MKVMRPVRLLAQGFQIRGLGAVIGSSPLIQSSGSFSVFERVLVLGLFMANLLATFRRKISDFWIVADEVRKARAAGLAAGVI